MLHRQTLVSRRERQKRRIRAAVTLTCATVLASTVSGCTVPESEFASYLKQALSVMDEGYYATSDAWVEARGEALNNASSYESVQEVYAELARLVKIAGGPHSRFLTPQEAETASSETTVEEGFETPSVSVADGIGTIKVPAYGSFEPDADQLYIDTAGNAIGTHVAEVTCGWIVDVRGNGGGDMWVMLAAVSPLLDEGQVARFVDREGRAEGVNVRGNALYLDDELIVEMTDDLRLAGAPVAVLHSPATASAAEGVVVAFHGQSRTRSFGQPTSGLSSANALTTLDDGSMVILTVSLFADRNNQEYGVPIEPDTRISLNNSDPNELSPTEWLQEECGVA